MYCYYEVKIDGRVVESGRTHFEGIQFVKKGRPVDRVVLKDQGVKTIVQKPNA